MTDGEKLVWAAAFVSKLDDVRTTLYGKDAKAIEREAMIIAAEAAEYGFAAVTFMHAAKATLTYKKQEDTQVFKRLAEMLEP